MGAEETMLYWKREWQLVSGINRTFGSANVKQKLTEIKHYLINGILTFKKPKEGSFEQFNKETKCKDENVFKFIQRLCNLLMLDVEQVWQLLSNYILYEYYGTTDSLRKVTLYETTVRSMLLNVWRFYTAERMFLIKTLRTILEFSYDKTHPFHNEYSACFDLKCMAELRKSLLKQLRFLLTEITTESAETSKDVLEAWVLRNRREQIELLHCILLSMQNVKLESVVLEELLVLFKMHDFGREPPCILLKTAALDLAQMPKVAFSELAILFCAFNDNWDTPDWLTKKIENEITALHSYSEHGAALLLVCLMHATKDNNKDIFAKKYSRYLYAALELGVFDFIYEMVNDDMFKPPRALGLMLQEAVFNIFQIISSSCNRYVEINENTLVISIVSTLLKNKQLFEKTSEIGQDLIMSLWFSAVSVFPCDFISASNLAQSFTTSGDKAVFEELMQKLKLPAYTEIYDPGRLKHSSRRPNDNSITVLEDYWPFIFHPFKIPSGTQAIIQAYKQITLIHFKIKFSFWDALLIDISMVLSDADWANDLIPKAVSRISSGLELIKAVLTAEPKALKKYPELVRVAQNVFDLFFKMSQLKRPPFRVLAACLDVFTELLEYHRKDVLLSIEGLRLLPTVAKDEYSYAEMVQVDFLDPGIIGDLITNKEAYDGECRVLYAYLEFLRTAQKQNSGTRRHIESPGLVFLLKEVLPRLATWNYRTEAIRHNVSYSCISFLHELLIEHKAAPGKKKNDDVLLQTMQRATIRSLLDMANGRALLRFIAVGNRGLLEVMMGCTDWTTGRSVRFFYVVQMAMEVLMRVLEMKQSAGIAADAASPLEKIIFSESYVNILRTVVGYLNHPFSLAIPQLACKMLKKFTMEIQISMLASMNLEPDQLRLMFLQRLRDEYEDEDLKIAIIDFITAGIERQPGMTEAFFKHNKSDGANEKGASYSEGITGFMTEFLTSLNADPKYLMSPLLAHVMDLFHTLWCSRKEMLVASLSQDQLFWQSLCSPLFSEAHNFNDKLYAQIFGILTREVHKTVPEISPNLKEVLEKLFDEKSVYPKMWTEKSLGAVARPKPGEAFNKRYHLTWAWRDFVTICVRKLPDAYFSSKVKALICDSALQALGRECDVKEKDLRIIEVLAELCMMITVDWRSDCFQDSAKTLQTISGILDECSFMYEMLGRRARDAVLTLSTVIVDCLKKDIGSNPRLARVILEPVVKIYTIEFDSLGVKDLQVQKGIENHTLEKYHKSLAISLSLLNDLIAVEGVVCAQNKDWLTQFQVVPKYIDCLRTFVREKSLYPLMKIAIQGLLNYAMTDFSRDVLFYDVELNLWDRLLPPKQYWVDQQTATKTQLKIAWEIREWWTTYVKLLNFISSLLEKHGALFIKQALVFVSIHHEVLLSFMMLQRYNVDQISLDLIISCLSLTYKLLKWKNLWEVEHMASFNSLMAGVQVAYNNAVAVVLRPNVLKHYTLDEARNKINMSENVPEKMLIATVNMSLKVMIVSLHCVLRFTPDLLSLMCGDAVQWSFIIDTFFGVPPAPMEPVATISFGSLLSASNLLVKILSQGVKSTSALPMTSSSPAALCAEKTNGLLKVDYMSPALNPIPNYATISPGFQVFARLDFTVVRMALESVLSLLASQTFLYHRDLSVPVRDRDYMRRELTSELGLFVEFVKKKGTNRRKRLLDDSSAAKKAKKTPNIPPPASAGDSAEIATMISDVQLAIFANVLGVSLFALVILYLCTNANYSK